MTLGEQLARKEAKLAQEVLFNSLLKEELTKEQIERAEAKLLKLLPMERLDI